MTEPSKAPFGVPIDEFARDGKQANAKAQVIQAVKLLNDAIKKAKAEGVFILFGLTEQQDVKVSFEDPGPATPIEEFKDGSDLRDRSKRRRY